MKAVIFNGTEKIELGERPDPKIQSRLMLSFVWYSGASVVLIFGTTEVCPLMHLVESGMSSWGLLKKSGQMSMTSKKATLLSLL